MIPREKKAKIVDALARATRTPRVIADRYSVSVDTVLDLRDEYGPDIPQLIASAAELRRPVPVDGHPKVDPPKPVEPAKSKSVESKPTPKKPVGDGLTQDERAACRVWAVADSQEIGSRGWIPADVVAAWNAAGRPEAATYDPAEIAPEPESPLESSEAVTEYLDATAELVAEILAEPEDDGVVDAEIVEDEPAADVVEDEPTPLHLAELIKIVLLDVQDLIPYAVVHMPVEVRDLVHAGEQFVEAVRCDQIDRQRVDQLAEVLFDMALRGDLAADRDRLADTARQILAVVDAA